eukprot:PhF_6_TR26719/c0_g1_i11/m.39111
MVLTFPPAFGPTTIDPSDSGGTLVVLMAFSMLGCSEVPEASWYDHPTQICINLAEYGSSCTIHSQHSGAIIMNTCMILAVTAVLCGMAYHSSMKNSTSSSSDHRVSTSYGPWVVRAYRCAPSRVLPFVYFWSDAVMVSAAFLMFKGRNGVEVGLGVVGGVLVGALPLWGSVWLSYALHRRYDQHHDDVMRSVVGGQYVDKIYVGRHWSGLLVKPTSHVMLCFLSMMWQEEDSGGSGGGGCNTRVYVALSIYGMCTLLYVVGRSYVFVSQTVVCSVANVLSIVAVVLGPNVLGYGDPAAVIVMCRSVLVGVYTLYRRYDVMRTAFMTYRVPWSSSQRDDDSVNRKLDERRQSVAPFAVTDESRTMDIELETPWTLRKVSSQGETTHSSFSARSNPHDLL